MNAKRLVVALLPFLLLAASCESSRNSSLSLIVALLNLADCSSISDPNFSDQWHLQNTAQTSGTSGEDSNVKSLWTSGNCGTGVSVAIVSDGLDIDHEDLQNNVERGKSYNYVNASRDPGTAGTGLGTAMAGIIAAEPNNKGVRGVAPYAKTSGLQPFSEQKHGKRCRCDDPGPVRGFHICERMGGTRTQRQIPGFDERMEKRHRDGAVHR